MRFPAIRSYLCPCLLLFGVGFLSAESNDEAEQAGDDSTSQWLQMALSTLDQFMLAGKVNDPARGAQFVDMFDWSPRKATREIDEFFEKKQDILSQYVSISRDLYGYEVLEKGFKGPNISVEGGVETGAGFTAEFSARLVFRDGRWLILSFELDGI